MNCEWSALLNIIPIWMRSNVDVIGRACLQEIRMRVGQAPELICSDRRHQLQQVLRKEDLEFTVNTASRYSPWAAQTVSKGYITSVGGHRIGICGSAATQNGDVVSIRDVASINIRVARQFPNIAISETYMGNILIIGRPGCGKTTLLRDLIRCRSNSGQTVCVVDERCELFPIVSNHYCFDTGKRTDVLSGCKKSAGVEMLLRVMNPDVIAVDEITAQEDCKALLEAGWCGVTLLATAHAASKQDFLSRPVYQSLVQSKLFSHVILMQPDKSWRTERI